MKWFVRKSNLRIYMKDIPDILKTGWGNGYVIIPVGHPMYKSHEVYFYDLEVHGGITYVSRVLDNRNWKELSDISVNNSDLIIGFDTAHAYSSAFMSTKEAVIQETLRLEKQIRLLMRNYKYID